MSKSILSLRFFSSDKLILITSNKVASRYCSLFFENGGVNNYGVQIDVDSDFNLVSYNLAHNYSSLYTLKDTIAITNLQKEWSDFLNKKNKKDVLFLYRDPGERTISGIVQEFIVVITDLQHNFITKLFIEKTYSEKIYTEFINNSVDSILKNGNKDLYNIYYNFLSEYIKYESSTLTQKHHIRPYLLYLYDFIKNYNLDKNKIHLLDIDNSESDIETILNKYGLEKKISNSEKFARASNGEIKKIVEKIISEAPDNKANHELFTAIRYITNMIEMETIFFEKIKKLPENILK
jgi:hypothetical protein